MRRLGLIVLLLAVAVGAAACERSEKPARGPYIGAGAGMSVPS